MLAVVAGVCAGPVNAAPLPDSAPQKLAEILRQPEFAARRVEQTKMSKAMEHLREKLREYLHRARQWLGQVKMPETGDSGFSRALKKILAPIADVLVWLIDLFMRLGGVIAFSAFFGLMLFAAYRLYRDRRTNQSVEEADAVPQAAPVSRAAVSVLVEMGRLSEAVSELRLAVRRVLEDKYAVKNSETDRRLLSKVPAADPRRRVFSETAKLFEHSAYAGMPLNHDEVRALYRTARAELGDEL